IDILLNGRETVSPAVNSAVSSLQRLNDSLHHTEGRLKGFNQIMELAFGMHVGRYFFERLHEGLGKAAEGFGAAQTAGQGFAESLKDAMRAALGLETHLEAITKYRKQLGEAQGFVGANAMASQNAIRAAMGLAPSHEFPNVANQAEVEK